MKAEWEVKPLNCVASIDKVKHSQGAAIYVGLEDISNDTLQFLGEMRPVDGKSSTFAFTPAHFLYGRLRPYLNKALLPDFNGHCSSEIFPILPSKKLDRSYLGYWMTSETVKAKIDETCTGTRMPRANMSEVMAFDIPIPPLEEQKRIVAVLDAAFEGLTRAKENAETNLQNARELFESYISERLRTLDAREISLAGMIELGWIQSHLDGNHGSNYPKKNEFIESGVPYVSANCIIDGEIELSLAKYLSAERADTLVKGTAFNRDVIFAHNATVGPVAVLETSEKRILLGTSVTHYRCNPEFLDPYFLCYEMRGAEFVSQYKSVMGQATRNQVPITIQRTFKHRIPDVKSQVELAGTARSAEASSRRLVADFQAKLTDIADLRQSLLQKAFAGELT